jgi:hypothetical protein
MATITLDNIGKNSLSENPLYQKIFQDAVIDKSYDYYSNRVPFEGFVAGDKLLSFAIQQLKGAGTSSRNIIRGFLSQFPSSATVDDADIDSLYNATLTNLDEFMLYMAGVNEADKTTTS